MATMTPPRSQQLFNLPNQLTAGRLGLAVVLFVLITYQAWWWCLGVFGLAALTDWLDGYLARRHGSTSDLGRMFDPLVDKVLVGGAFIFLLPLGTQEGWLTPWMVTLIVSRELLITGWRGFLEQQGAQFGADWLGKWKMGLQCAAVVAIFVVLLPQADPWVDWLRPLRDGLIWIMLLVTLASGLQYVWKGWRLLKTDGR
jgi:CDP-diacylglycerol--glycerol-3-phosphate 3-phosphatidyltransferase